MSNKMAANYNNKKKKNIKQGNGKNKLCALGRKLMKNWMELVRWQSSSLIYTSDAADD